MKVTIDTNRILPLLLSIPGVVALFLPFIAIPMIFGMWYPPLVELLVASAKPMFGLGTAFFAPLFLSIPILIWQARRLLVPRVRASEVVLAYTLSGAAMLLTLIGTVVLLNEYKKSPLEAWVVIVPCWLLLGGNISLLARNLKLHIDRGLSAEVLLMGSYIAAAIISVISELLEGLRYSLVGWWLTVIACISYVFLIVRLLRKALSVPINTLGR